jgi:hypothetical protein
MGAEFHPRPHKVVVRNAHVPDRKMVPVETATPYLDRHFWHAKPRELVHFDQ